MSDHSAIEWTDNDGNQDVPSFVATRHELFHLVQYWETEALELEYFWFWSAQWSSGESNIVAVARQRVNDIAAVIGDDIVNQIVDRVWADFGKTHKDWDVFVSGDAAAWRKVQDDVQRQFGDTGADV